MSKFCHACGAPTKPEICAGQFDIETGEPIIRFVCSVAPCEHHDHDWTRVEHSSGWLRWLKDPEIKCRRCGEVGVLGEIFG